MCVKLALAGFLLYDPYLEVGVVPVPLRSRSGSYCRLPHQVGLIWKTFAFAFAFGILHAHVLNVYMFYAGNYVFSNSFLI